MRISFFYYTILCVFMNLSTECNSQHPAVPPDAYGVWDRSNAKDPTLPAFDYLLGIKADITWKELQPNDSSGFNWTPIQEVLEKAYKTQQYVKANIFVGPDAPDWIYEQGVPKVFTNSDTHSWPYYPYYPDADYKRYYKKMIQEFAHFIFSQPSHLTKRLAFVQVMTGCTGDEAPFKGKVLNPDFEISDEQWSRFRLEAFEQFKTHFNDGKLPSVKLLFNCIDPIKYPREYTWVNTHIDKSIGYGIKGSAFVRGHHLTGESTFRELWYNQLVNPKEVKLFSAAEMDQSWTKPLYQINVPLGFYWGALNGLNTGLSGWNVCTSAIDYADSDAEISDIFRMFTKYAKQVYPSTATVAWCVFHEGLDARNTKKFPESIYGRATIFNHKRYQRICKAYKKYGAKIDDLKAMELGQVKQRSRQKGYNDVGWDIHEGNYERWLIQINPEETTIPLFRVRGKIGNKSSIYDRFARSFDHKNDKNIMYFKFHEGVFGGFKPKKLSIKITWLDRIPGSEWEVKYVTFDGRLKTASRIKGTGNGQWKCETFDIHDASLNHKGEKGSDFIIVNTDTKDDIFHGIEVDILR